jgi:hypothetical protein
VLQALIIVPIVIHLLQHPSQIVLTAIQFLNFTSSKLFGLLKIFIVAFYLQVTEYGGILARAGYFRKKNLNRIVCNAIALSAIIVLVQNIQAFVISWQLAKSEIS